MTHYASMQSARASSVLERPVSVAVVDGEPKTANVLDKLLRVDGFLVEVFADAAALEARLERGPLLDVLVMDVSPARAGEVEAARRLHARYPALPLIVVTAYPQVAERLGSTAPQCRIVTKPIDYPGLLRLLEVCS